MGTSIKKSLIANYSGQIWISLLGIIVVPVYIRFLGIEAYGLIGVLLTITALIAYMDFGLSKAANREVARRSNSSELIYECHDILRSLEVIYLVIGIVISVSLFLLADFLSTNWLNSEGLSEEIVRYSIVLHGITLGLRWPITLYTEVLRGLEEQVLLNVLITIVATISKAGSIIVVVFVSSSIITYLKWTLAISLIELLVLYYFTWIKIPKKKSVDLFAVHLMRDIWKFSMTLSITSFFATIIKQLDKILVSRLLPLEQMGYYMTATTVTNNLIKLVNPTIASVFPRMSSLFFQKNDKVLGELYHKATQVTQIVIAPFAWLLVFYSYEVLLIWTQSESVAINTHTALTVLSVAVLFNTALQTHYSLILAGGLTWIPMMCNIVASLLLAPIIYYSIVSFGISGAGLSWLILNVTYFFIIPRITHSYLLKHEYYRWIFNDTLLYICSSAFVFFTGFIIKSYFGINGLPVILLIMASFVFYLLILLYFKPLLVNDIKNSVNSFLIKTT